MPQKAIGPSFYQELVAYGNSNDLQLVGAHFSWDSQGNLYFYSDTPAAVVTGVDAVYAAHNPATIPWSQQVETAIIAGLQVVSTGTPSLNGIYAVDPLSQHDIVAIETSLNAGKGFPGGVTTFNYPDMGGMMHAFTEANFTDFAAAVRDYVYALKSVIAGEATVLPASSVAIS